MWKKYKTFSNIPNDLFLLPIKNISTIDKDIDDVESLIYNLKIDICENTVVVYKYKRRSYSILKNHSGTTMYALCALKLNPCEIEDFAVIVTRNICKDAVGIKYVEFLESLNFKIFKIDYLPANYFDKLFKNYFSQKLKMNVIKNLFNDVKKSFKDNMELLVEQAIFHLHHVNRINLYTDKNIVYNDLNDELVKKIKRSRYVEKFTWQSIYIFTEYEIGFIFDIILDVNEI